MDDLSDSYCKQNYKMNKNDLTLQFFGKSNSGEKDILYSKNFNYFLIFFIGCYAFLYLVLIPKTNINWDEFYFLSKIYDYEANRNLSPLQTFHVHIFKWIKFINGNEIDQIIVARYVQVTFLFASCFIIFKLSKQIFNTTSALYTVILIMSYTDVIRHGFSFRFDPICLFAFLFALFLIFKKHQFSFFLSGIVLAIGFLVSIKMSLYIFILLPIFLLSIYYTKNRADDLMKWSIFFLSFFFSVIMLYIIHSDLLIQPESSTNSMLQGTSTKILSIGIKMFSDLFPRLPFILRTILENILTWFIIFVSIFMICHNIFQKDLNRYRYFILLSFVLPIISLIFYRNAFPYFFVFIMPPALIIIGSYVEIIEKFYMQKKRFYAYILFFVPLIFIVYNTSSFINIFSQNQLQSQREIVELVHQLFPEEVAYIDRNSMISTYPKVGFFMSTWGLESYRKNNDPIMRDVILNYQPKFLIANTPALELDNPSSFGQENNSYHLLDVDFIELKNNYIHHWGAIYVPGKEINFQPPGDKIKFEILIEGFYTIETEMPTIINDQIFNDGQFLFFATGIYTICSEPGNNVILRWGKNLYRPDNEPSEQPIYIGL